jgi:hypothetical protein
VALTYGEQASITLKKFMPKLVDNIFASNALLQRWRRNKTLRTIDGGRSIMVPVAYATTTASGWYSGADTLDTTANDQITAAEFDWKFAYSNMTITREDELKNSGVSGVVNFVKSKVQLSEKTLADNIGTGIFNLGTTTKAIIGLRLMVDSAGTYGGINRTTSSWWAAQEDSTTTILSLALMQGLQGDAQVDSDKFDVWAATQDIYDIFYALVQPQQRFQDTETAKAGFTNLLFNGKPVIVDSHCPSSNMFGLNENYIEFVVHKDENFRFEPFIKPVNQNVSSAKIYFAGALTCSNCRMQGKLGAIAS